jgi:hypothetical protein
MNKRSLVVAAAAMTCGLSVTGSKMSNPQTTSAAMVNSYLNFGTAFALGAASDSCFATFDTVRQSQPKAGTYQDKVLEHLHDELWRFNALQTADIELIFCRLVNVMQFNPDLSQLPQTLTKTDPLGSKVTVTVTVPTESFAKNAGYLAKAAFQYDSSTFMTMWWAGSGASSKGYLIQGANPMEKDGNTRLRYVQWDRTSNAQSLKFFGTQFASSFLSNASASSTSTTGGDQAIYARLSYDSSTQKVTTQAVEIRQDPNSSNFACVRTYFDGTLGGTISAYRPAKGTPEPVTETSTGGCSDSSANCTSGGLDGEVNVTDATTTADHSGSPSSGSNVASATFDYSCHDIDTANATNKPFNGDTVDYTTDPSTVFPK